MHMDLVALDLGTSLRLRQGEPAWLGRGQLPGLEHRSISHTHLQCTARDRVVQRAAGKLVTLQRHGSTSTEVLQAGKAAQMRQGDTVHLLQTQSSLQAWYRLACDPPPAGDGCRRAASSRGTAMSTSSAEAAVPSTSLEAAVVELQPQLLAAPSSSRDAVRGCQAPPAKRRRTSSSSSDDGGSSGDGAAAAALAGPTIYVPPQQGQRAATQYQIWQRSVPAALQGRVTQDAACPTITHAMVAAPPGSSNASISATASSSMPPGVHWVTEQWLFASLEARSLQPEALYQPAAAAEPPGSSATGSGPSGGSSGRARAPAGITAQQLAEALAKVLAGQGRPRPPTLCRRHYRDGGSFSLLTYNIW